MDRSNDDSGVVEGCTRFVGTEGSLEEPDEAEVGLAKPMQMMVAVIIEAKTRIFGKWR